MKLTYNENPNRQNNFELILFEQGEEFSDPPLHIRQDCVVTAQQFLFLVTNHYRFSYLLFLK